MTELTAVHLYRCDRHGLMQTPRSVTGEPRCSHHQCIRPLTGPHPMLPETQLVPIVTRAMSMARRKLIGGVG